VGFRRPGRAPGLVTVAGLQRRGAVAPLRRRSSAATTGGSGGPVGPAAASYPRGGGPAVNWTSGR
jgi:hypothetical protein